MRPTLELQLVVGHQAVPEDPAHPAVHRKASGGRRREQCEPFAAPQQHVQVVMEVVVQAGGAAGVLFLTRLAIMYRLILLRLIRLVFLRTGFPNLWLLLLLFIKKTRNKTHIESQING